mmetsp:Transcript_22550/g.49173  ORF Transcript_22550/g.49173 Transcript_22550/m.49173 type:complete len:429 (+) Transcript_22550:112-1398(+)
MILLTSSMSMMTIIRADEEHLYSAGQQQALLFLIVGLTVIVVVVSFVWMWQRVQSPEQQQVQLRDGEEVEEDDETKTVSGLFIYPVKSLRAVELPMVTLDAKGFCDDRRFMLIAPRVLPIWKTEWAAGQASHRFVSQRQLPILATVVAELRNSSGDEGDDDGDTRTLQLSSHLLPGVTVRVPILPPNKQPQSKDYLATLWDDVVRCQDMGDEAAHFFRQLLQQSSQQNDTDGVPDEYRNMDLRLVRQAPSDPRVTDGKFTPAAAQIKSMVFFRGQNPPVALTDGFPLLIATEASLAELNRRLTAKKQTDKSNGNTTTTIPMNRFRPNIAVAGGQAFEEDHWKIISIDGVLFHICKACPRCKQSCTDQTHGRVESEPLQTLREFRALSPDHPDDVFFAQNVIANAGMQGRTLSKGAVVKVVEWGEPVWG